MGINNYRMAVQKGVAGVGNNPDGLDISYTYDDGVTPVEIYETIEFRAEFPATPYDCLRKVEITEGEGITVDRATGSISVAITSDTFTSISVPDGQSRRGDFSISHFATDGKRRLILKGVISLEDTLYV